MRYPYIATLHRLVNALCKLFAVAYPVLLTYPFTGTELALLAALRTACQDFAAQGHIPGEG